MKRAAILVSILAVIAVGVYIAFGNPRVNQALLGVGSNGAAGTGVVQTTQGPATTIPPIKASDQVVAGGSLVPVRFVNLSFNTGGLVSEVLVREGETVSEGQVIAHLTNQEKLEAAVSSAQLDVINAQQALDDLYTNAPLKSAEALQSVVNAPIAVQDAERALNNLKASVVDDADIDIARANLTFAENKLNNAQDAYAPYANKPEDNLQRAALLSKLAQAQKEYDAALRTLNSMTGTPSEQKISQAEADLLLAKAQQTEAERVYEILKDGPDPKEVALAEAKLKDTQSQLTAAQAALGNLELRAPFTGTVVTVDLKSGEYVNPGVSVLMIADFSDWRIETTDLTELNVVRIKENDPVRVTFDAIPGVEFPGRVSFIRTLGESRQGDITYTVLIDLEKYDPRLRWNMTCSAVIGTSQ